MEAAVSKYLVQRGYSHLRSAMSQVNVFFRVDNDLAMAILLIDGRQFVIDVPTYHGMKSQIGQMFEAKGYANICVFSIFMTSNLANVQRIAGSDEFFWAIDLNARRLCIFENGMRDFDDLRDGLSEVVGTASSRQNDDQTVGQWIIDHTIRNPAPVTVSLILLNVLAFIAIAMFGSFQDSEYMVDVGAMYAPWFFDKHQYYRLLTSMFIHFGFEHIAANMFALAIFGSRVERLMGHVRYLVLYILSGLAAGMLSIGVGVFLHTTHVSAGASGAIFGVIGALFIILIRNKGRLGDMTAGRAAFLICYSVFSGFAAEGVDNAAHIGGLLMGLLLGFILYKKSGNRKVNKENAETGA